MAGFGDLSDELLVEIIRLLASDRLTLHQLAIVNKRMNGMVLEILARRVDVDVQIRDRRLALRFGLLMRSLDKRPCLNLSVQNLTIRCKEIRGRGRPKIKAANKRANELLQRLPNLRSLTIQWSDYKQPFSPDFLLLQHPTYLREVTFLGLKTSLDVVSTFMNVRSVESIVVNEVYPKSDVSSQPEALSPVDPCNLTSLDLGIMHLRPLELQKLVKQISRITTFACAMPGIERPTKSRSFRPTEVYMVSPLSPASILQIFWPLHTTLVELRLHTGYHAHWNGHDGTRMNLSRFGNLKVVNLPDSCFFFARGPQYPRQSVRELLPRSLKELKVIFDFQNSFLFTEREMDDYFRSSRLNTQLYSFYASRFAWLSELVQSSVEGDHGPALSSIVIEEQINAEWERNYVRHIWQPPSRLKEDCLSAGLDLRVSLRKASILTDLT